MASSPARTDLIFHRDASQHTLATSISSITPFTDVPDSSKALFKAITEDPDSLFVVTCPATIFHPQGGGQPSDIGSIASGSTTFEVVTARTDDQGQVLHLGRFATPDAAFQPSDSVAQTVNAEKRLLFSRLHTAGHVLGSAVRSLLESEVPGFDELKASHFPDSAACEFAGSIEGKWKEPIQKRVDEYVEKGMPVEIEWWDEDDFRKNGLERLTPDRKAMGLEDGEKFRVVNIVGAEVYPCGGTHVPTTKECGKTVVRKIGRSKGTSRVSYTVEGT